MLLFFAAVFYVNCSIIWPQRKKTCLRVFANNTGADQPAYGPQRKKTCLRVFANNTGADQPAHARSLISAFVFRFLESSICKLATDEISIF